MSYTQNLSVDRAAAVAVLLINSNITFSCNAVPGHGAKMRHDISVAPEHKAALLHAIQQVHNAKQSRVCVQTGIDSDAQSGSYMNGTLSHVAPGLAITVQVSPAFTREAMTESEAHAVFPDMFLSLAAQGWQVDLILGEDKDRPT